MGLGGLPDSSFLSQSEPEGFSHFHLYVCAAFLIKWRKEILDEEDFQVSVQKALLQRLPRAPKVSPVRRIFVPEGLQNGCTGPRDPSAIH